MAYVARPSHMFAAIFVAAALAATTPNAAQPTRGPIGTPSAATVNRTVPRVAPPPQAPSFSERPTAEDLRRARIFAEPLLALGPTSDEENRTLAAAVQQYVSDTTLSRGDPFSQFLTDYPNSAWRASLLANLAVTYRSRGFYSRALRSWEEAWRLTHTDNSRAGRAVADMAAGDALDMLARMGHAPGLDRWLERTNDRNMSGPAAAKAARAREVRAILSQRPERVVASGPMALEVLLAARAGSRERPSAPALTGYVPTAAGTSLTELRDLGSRVNLPLQAVRREADGSPVVPSIVHLGFDHFSAVIEEARGRYHLRDPALGGDVWMPREALEEEMSGYALIAAGPVPSGWRTVSTEEAAAVVGHSCPPGIPDPDDNSCPLGGDGGGQPGGGPGCGGGQCSPGAGLPVYAFHPVQASVLLRDTPVGYGPPRGPEVAFRIRYNHREENQPQIFSFANLGPKWTANWFAYVEEVPWTWYDGYAQPTHVAVHVPEGGVERYIYPSADGVYGRHHRSAAVLAMVRQHPIRYERTLTDGSREVYDVADGAPEGQRRIFLSRIVDPHGQTVQFTWDSQLRLVAVTDALGQVTTLQYDDGTDPLKLTSVTDPFGRLARFTYTTNGQLASTTDVAGLSGTFLYGYSDFIDTMITPYGSTRFRQPQMTAQYDRAVEATDVLGATERLEFHYDLAPVPETVPADQVPPGFESKNAYLNQIVSFYWSKGRNFSEISEATQLRWLIYSIDWYWDPGWTVGVRHSEQRPGEARIWYSYTTPAGTGPSAQPTRVARRLPDGTVDDVQSAHNLQDRVTWRRDPAGREITYVYAANGIDLLEVRNTTSGRNDLLARYDDYTSGHQPQTIVDAAGQVTGMIYNAAGQVRTVTNAKQETTTYVYDTDGYLQTVTGPVTGSTTTYTYDAHGRVRTIIADGVTTTHEYDALDRPTRVLYPDGTSEQTTYDRLDAATWRDRRGRITRYTYDPRRALVAVRDPAGRVVQQQWGIGGTLDALIDANGQKTRWERDLGGRVLREVRADNLTTTAYAYDGFGRLRTVTDPKQQVATYTYFADGALASVVYTNAAIATPGVAWTYDLAYGRVATMVDGTGTTSYTYHPVGQLGAGQVATVDGPLANDIISYTYDELGRVTTRAIDGVPLALTYDTLGRVEREVNALGTFTYTYDGVTGRLATVAYPNGQTSTYRYYPAAQEHLLQTIHHKYPDGSTLSKFDYTYDAVGNILTWRQQADTAAVMWEYGYDNADQLTRAVKRATDPQGTILQRFAYGYDPAGNRLFEQIDDQVTTWTYDKLNRLVDQRAGGLLRVAGQVDEPAIVRVGGQPASVDANRIFVGGVSVGTRTSTFTVTATDASGNTGTKTFEIDQTGASKSFTFDANGNLTADGTRTFEWDARNQLVAAATAVNRSEFQYDGVQRRVRATERVNGTIVSDSRLIWESGAAIEERDGLGQTVIARYLDRGVARPGDSKFITYDHLGSNRESTDAIGALQSRASYDAYGRSVSEPPVNAIPFGFASMDSKSPHELSLASYRAYDASLGRWLSRDPIGLNGGPNVYAYVDNNPINAVDRQGLQGRPPFPPPDVRTPSLPSRFPRPEKACCDKEAIKKAIDSVQGQLQRMRSGQSPRGTIGGTTLRENTCQPDGWCTPWPPPPDSSFDPNTSEPDPCVRHCITVHEWVHFNDRRRWHLRWPDVEINRHAEWPAYQRELSCLRSFQ